MPHLKVVDHNRSCRIDRIVQFTKEKTWFSRLFLETLSRADLPQRISSMIIHTPLPMPISDVCLWDNTRTFYEDWFRERCLIWCSSKHQGTGYFAVNDSMLARSANAYFKLGREHDDATMACHWGREVCGDQDHGNRFRAWKQWIRWRRQRWLQLKAPIA